MPALFVNLLASTKSSLDLYMNIYSEYLHFMSLNKHSDATHHMASHPVRLAVDLLCQGILRYNTIHDMTVIRYGFPFLGQWPRAILTIIYHHGVRHTLHGTGFTIRRISVQSLNKILYMH